jgi:hypothetical protein
MTNNKQSMKLYTEEQVKKMLEVCILSDLHPGILTCNDVLKTQTPIDLPSDEKIWRWWQTQKFQKEQGEQEYTMLYEIDLPKILKAFIEHFIKTGGNNEQQ